VTSRDSLVMSRHSWNRACGILHYVRSPAERMSRYRIAAAAVAAWVLLALAFAVPEYFLSRFLGQPFTWRRALIGVAPHYAMWAVLALAVAALARRWPIQRPLMAMRLILHFLLSLTFWGIDCVASLFLLPAIVRDPHLTPDFMRVLFLRGFYDDFVLYWAIVGTVHLYQYHHRLVQETERRAQLQREFAVAQLSVLRSQLQPHFLFNTLNTIAELVHVDTYAAECMIDSLSDLLRSTLTLVNANEIPLAEELEMLDVYLRIQQVRFSDSVTIERNIDPEALAARVPPLLLQPLVENAFRHGLARRRQQGRLSIGAHRDGDRLQLTVRDNGAGLPPEVHEGLGLRTTRASLEQLHGKNQTMRIDSDPQGGVRVAIDLPYREEAS
jgi:two-component system LytT family sensor kinase